LSASPRPSAGTLRRATILLSVIGGLMVLLAVGAAAASAEQIYDVEPPEVELAPGGRLVCEAGSWDGSPSFSYTWLRDGSAFATGSVYSLTKADAGYTFTCIVLGKGGENSEEEESWNAYEVPGGGAKPPANVSAPDATGGKAGEAKVGETLECGQGTWTGTTPITYTYEWLREGLPIASASAKTYAVGEEDEGYSLSCKVTATNSAGAASKQSSNSLKVAGSAPSLKSAPQVLGSGTVGQQLTCSPGSWKGAPAPTFKYEWLRNGSAITGAIGATYTIQEADQLHALSCKVTATNSYGEAKAESSNKVEVSGSPPSNTELPRILGKGEVGAKLTCEPGKWSGDPTPTLEDQWLLGSETIPGATSTTYTVPSEDAGRTISCEVVGRNTLGKAVAKSQSLDIAGVSPTKSIPEPLTLPMVEGEPARGNTLTCTTGTWTENPPVSEYTYQWLREKVSIKEATSSSYRVEPVDVGTKLICQVTARNSIGTAKANSEAVAVKGTKPEDKSPPSVSGAKVVGETLTCAAGSWEGLPKPTFSYRWLGITGPASGNSYVIQKGDRGHQLYCEVTATNIEGTTSARSAAFEIPAIPPKLVSGPSISGTSPPVVGTVLTCNSKWAGEPEPAIGYVWLTDGGAIEGATASTYVVTKFEQGHLIACEVVATNAAGTERAVSARVHIPGSAPEIDAEQPPMITGQPQVGDQLTCEPGLWHGKPSPTLQYQWLINGSEIAGATEQTYIPEQAQLGDYISCEVIATSTEGSAEASSENAPQIVPKAVKKLEVLGVPQFTKESTPKPPTSAQILADLEKQLSAALKKARRSGLLKRDSYSFAFEAPTGGKLEVLCYQPQKSSKTSSKTKPVLLARVRTSFGAISKETEKLALTLAGRRALKDSKHPKLAVKVVFTPTGGTAVTWSKTIVLSG
jgi:hypothetical protein